MTYVLSLGGSIVAPPEGPDARFLADFAARMEKWLDARNDRRVIVVVGGGTAARTYQAAYRSILSLRTPSPSASEDEALDWIGVAATRLNAQLVKAALGPLCVEDVVTDPSAPIAFFGRVLVASGWKPGFSSDYDAVYLGERFGASLIINLSNIAKVYTADPRIDPDAKPLDVISWPRFRRMVGDQWTPGANLPFDPIASAKAEAGGMKVICAAGRNLDNLFRILDDLPFEGTTIG